LRTTSDKPPKPALRPGSVRPERPRSQAAPRIRGLRGESGVAIVEFALVLPLLMLIVVVILDFGRAINYWIDTTHLASEGARLAAVDRVPGGAGLQDYIRSKADTEELRDGGSRSIDSPLRVCVTSGGNDVGDPVEVKVTTTYKWIPLLGIGPSSDITGSATMRREREPNRVSEGCA
jgi:Flp pilus assembly protein TadG